MLFSYFVKQRTLILAAALLGQQLFAIAEKNTTDSVSEQPSPKEMAEKLNPKDLEDAPVALKVPAEPIQVYGYKEWVYIGSEEYKLKSKLDTGAKTSSIHVEKTHLFERDGKKWVRFVIVDPDKKEKKGALVTEAPLIRIASIKSSNGHKDERFVVELRIRIGDRHLSEQFSLSDRAELIHPVLLGRETIKNLGWVDPARKYLADDKIFR